MSALTELTASSARQLVRNPKLIFSLAFSFGFILLLCIGLDAVLPVPFLELNLGMILALGLLSIAFTGTTVPLVAMREHGTLRLFGTTPVSRLSFIVGQVPVRFAIGLAEAVVVLLIALLFGLDPLGALRFAVTVVVGLALFFSLGFLFAARARNSELATQLTGLLPVIVLATSGTAFPIEVYPEVVQVAFQVLPTTWFMQAVNADLTGAATFLPEPLLWLMMAAVAVIVALVAARMFRWDAGED